MGRKLQIEFNYCGCVNRGPTASIIIKIIYVSCVTIIMFKNTNIAAFVFVNIPLMLPLCAMLGCPTWYMACVDSRFRLAIRTRDSDSRFRLAIPTRDSDSVRFSLGARFARRAGGGVRLGQQRVRSADGGGGRRDAGEQPAAAAAPRWRRQSHEGGGSRLNVRRPQW